MWDNEATSLLCWGLGHRWEELHTLASEPREQHVLMAEQVEDATNGFFSTLSSSAICASASPGKSFQAGRVDLPMWEQRMGWGGFPKEPPQGGKVRRAGSRSLSPGVLRSVLSACVRPCGFLSWNSELVSVGQRGHRAWALDLVGPLCLSLLRRKSQVSSPAMVSKGTLWLGARSLHS